MDSEINRREQPAGAGASNQAVPSAAYKNHKYADATDEALRRAGEWGAAYREAMNGNYQESLEIAKDSGLVDRNAPDLWRHMVEKIKNLPWSGRTALMESSLGERGEQVAFGMCMAANRADIAGDLKAVGGKPGMELPPPFGSDCYSMDTRNGQCLIDGLKPMECGRHLADTMRVCVHLRGRNQSDMWYRADGMAEYHELAEDKLAKIIIQMSTKFDASRHDCGEIILKVKAAAREITPEQWDADHDIDLMANGVYARRSTGEVLSRGVPPVIDGQEYLARRPLGAAWDPGAHCPKLLKMLLTGGTDPLDVLWAMAACLAFGSEIIVILVGPSGSGKSVLARMLGALLGESNRINISPEQLAQSRFSLVELAGKRAMIKAEAGIDESGEFGKKSNVLPAIQMLKACTGGDDGWADVKFKAGQAVKIDLTPFLCFNILPEIGAEAETDAWERRAFVIEMSKQFGDDQIDRSYKALPENAGEVAGLYQLISPMAALLEEGYSIPRDPEHNSFRAKILQHAEHRQGELAFIRQMGLKPSRTMLERSGPDGRPTLEAVWQAYRDHEINADRQPMSIKKFGRALRRHDFKSEVVTWSEGGKLMSARLWVNMAGAPPEWYVRGVATLDDPERQ